MSDPAPEAASPAQAPGARGSYARSAGTRARILRAAMDEASEVGFHKTSLARIASRAEVALGSLSYHFGSKAELLRNLMGSAVADLQARLEFAVPADSDDFFAQERAGLLTYLGYLRENPGYVRLADEVKLHEPELYRESVEAWVEQFVARVRGGIERRVLRPVEDGEIRVQGYFLLGAHLFLDRLIDADAYPGDEFVADALIGLVRSGLGRTAG